MGVLSLNLSVDNELGFFVPYIVPMRPALKNSNTSAKLTQPQRVQKHFDDILSAISQGQSLASQLERLHVNWKFFYEFLEASPDARKAYGRARSIGVEKWVDEIIPMSDAAIGEDMHIVTATRNAVDARKWIAGKLAPAQYGDSPSVAINSTTNILVVSEEKQRELQETRRKLLDGTYEAQSAQH